MHKYYLHLTVDIYVSFILFLKSYSLCLKRLVLIHIDDDDDSAVLAGYIYESCDIAIK